MTPDGFELLYENGPCLVVVKPGGVLSQAPPGIDSMEVRVRRYLLERESKTGNIYLVLVHRLDRPVSGALLLARNVRAAKRLGAQFEGRMVRKVYWAAVEGEVSPDEGTWTDYVRKVPGEPRSEVVPREHPEGRIAILHYRVRDRAAGRTWLEIELETGRTHQIRIQTSSRGLPIVGDELYGAQSAFGPPSDDPRDRWIALHARRLEFRHPMIDERVQIEAPLPEAWQTLGFNPALL